MIYSNKQLNVSTRELAKLIHALGSKQSEHLGQDWVREAEIKALKSQIAELRADIKHYQMLKRGEITVAKAVSLEGAAFGACTSENYLRHESERLGARARHQTSADSAL